MIDWVSRGRYNAADSLQFEFRNEFIAYLLHLDESLGNQVAWASHPVGQRGRLVVDVDEMGMLAVEIMDLQGRKLKAFVTPHGGGRQVHDFDLGLAPGVYVYRVHVNGKGLSGRLVVE